MKKLTLCIGLLCGLGLVFDSYGQSNIILGSNVLSNNTTGYYNVGVGNNALSLNTAGYENIGIGVSALYYNTTGYENIGIGNLTLSANSTGNNNTGIGNQALFNNISGSQNIGIGNKALYGNSRGSNNIGIGSQTLYYNISGYENTGIGNEALYNNTTGHNNSALGDATLFNNTTGSYNVAFGNTALTSNTTGQRNTAIGVAAARQNTTGRYTTAVGYDALRYNTTGTGSTALGYKSMAVSAASTYSYAVALGAYSTATASYQVRVGYFGTSSIGGSQNWTNLSDGRFKKEVQEDVLGLDFIKKLRPVSYYVDNEAVNKFLGVALEAEAINNKKQYQTGFIAQEVESTAKELGFDHFGGVDAPANDKSHYGLRYAEFVVPLVKSVQELSKQNEDQNEAQKAIIETLKEALAQQQLQINTLLDQANKTLDIDGLNGQVKAKLHQNTPNPFTNETQINLFVPTEVGQALIQVCTIDGKQLFVKEVAGRDETSITISANNLPAGIYMYTLIVDNEIITSKRMVLTK